MPEADWAGRSVAVTGGAGFLGQPTVRLLQERGAEVTIVRSAEHDLRDPDQCLDALRAADTVIHLAANVCGGIGYNRRNPGSLGYDNLIMGTNVFEACRSLEVSRLVVACSVCAYPKETEVPFKEADLWDGYPEESNAPYGLAKKMLLVLSDGYRRQYGLDSSAPVIANLYGPGDNFDPEDSHVIPAMIGKYIQAADDGEDEVVLWGTGEPTREFLFVDDAARAMVLTAEHGDSSEPFNVGTGQETRIRDLADMISELTGFSGRTVWDSSRPDGQAHRYLDVSRAREQIGFQAEVALEDGLKRTIDWFRSARTPGRP